MSKVVVIDAGHGGHDPGAVGHGLEEEDITLEVATKVAHRLQEQYGGVRCLLTRSSDVYLTLEERTDIANKADADLLVSIHVNAGKGKGGFESFTYNGITDQATTAFQSTLHTEIMKQLKPFNVIDRGQKKKDLHMVRESKMPAVLTECLFIDVASNAALLKRADVIEALVDGHVLGIAKHLGLKAKQDNLIDVYVDGKFIGKGEIKDGKTTIPVRVVCEAVGAKVTYSKNLKRIDIRSKGV